MRGVQSFFPSSGDTVPCPSFICRCFQSGVTHITSELAFEKKDGCITYFNGHVPVFTHGEKDVAAFRMITSQFCESGYAKQSDIIRAFGVTSISVKRSVKLYREKGTGDLYA